MYRVLVRVHGQVGWIGNAERFENRSAAIAAAERIGAAWTAVRTWMVATESGADRLLQKAINDDLFGGESV